MSLTKTDLAWVRYHTKLAEATNYDFISFAESVVMPESESDSPEEIVEVVKPSKPKVYREIRDDFYDDSDIRADFELAELKKYCRSASLKDYNLWLNGYLKTGGSVRATDYSFTGRNWLVLAVKPAYIPALYGSNSFHLIIPANVTVPNIRKEFHGRCGHSTIYFMKDFTYLGSLPEIY